MTEESLYKPPEPTKDSVRIIFWVSTAMKESFMAICKNHGTDMSRVLRNFIEREIERNSEGS